MVGAKGFEPSTSWSRTRRASQAALRPDNRKQQENALLQGGLEYHSEAEPATDCFSVHSANEALLRSTQEMKRRPWGSAGGVFQLLIIGCS